MLWALDFACALETTEAAPPDTCNGHAELCERRFDEVMLAGTHNSMSNAVDGFFAPNQPDGPEAQLQAGIRAFLLDTYVGLDGEPALCHGYCELGSLPLVETLTTYRRFLDDNRGEVIAFLLEDYLSAEDTEAAFDAADLTRLTYTWSGGDWPTLGEMVAADRRLVVTAGGAAGIPEWYQPMWSLYVDTPYAFTSVDAFSCEVNRGAPENPLVLVNHWVEDPFPTQGLAAEANTADVLQVRVEACAAAFGRTPSVLAVDWYTEGALMDVVDAANGVGP